VKGRADTESGAVHYLRVAVDGFLEYADRDEVRECLHAASHVRTCDVPSGSLSMGKLRRACRLPLLALVARCVSAPTQTYRRSSSSCSSTVPPIPCATVLVREVVLLAIR
jgi:hypothetical protein